MNKVLPESVEQRIKTAATIVAGYRTEDQIREALIKMGVESPDDLNAEWIERGRLLHIVGYDDEKNPTPEVKAKRAVAALYGSQTAAASSRVDELKNLGFKDNVKLRPTSDLFRLYRPELADDPVTQILKERLGSRKVILFIPGTNEVDIEATIGYLSDLEQGYDESELVETKGGPTRPIAVGQKPDSIVDEDPLHAGLPLRRERSTVEPYINWKDVSHDARKLCRIIAERGDVNLTNRREVFDLVKLATSGTKAMEEYYPEAAVQFRELQQLGKLPSLRMVLNGKNVRNDPFKVKKSY